MKISPISANYQSTSVQIRKIPPYSQVQFRGKHSGMKWGTIIFGSMAALGAVGGTLIMSGGLAAIPWAAAYIGIGAGSGAAIGHLVEKGAEKSDKEEKNLDKKI